MKNDKTCDQTKKTLKLKNKWIGLNPEESGVKMIDRCSSEFDTFSDHVCLFDSKTLFGPRQSLERII